MTKVEFITTPGGYKMAVLPFSEYERLIEAAEELSDIAASTLFPVSCPPATMN
jgi:hypothetical protein